MRIGCRSKDIVIDNLGSLLAIRSEITMAYECVLKYGMASHSTDTTPCPEKRCHFIICHNFAKSQPIFKILLPSHSAVNLQ